MIVLHLKGREVLDSRGNPTIEAEVKTDKGVFSAIVPSGASTGIHEALELRDGGKRYLGMGVLKAVKNINEVIAKKITKKIFTEQRELDETLIKLDGTPNKKKLGANAILAVSMACCRAFAAENSMTLYEYIAHISDNKTLKLPVPAFNIINGGKHAQNNLDFQEFMILPVKAKTFAEALRMGSEVYHCLKKEIMKSHGRDQTNVGDEGGFAPKLQGTDEAIQLILNAVKDAGYKNKIVLGIDCAASEFFKNGKYYFEGMECSSVELIDRYAELIQKYPIKSIEDPLAQDDWQAWQRMADLMKGIQIVGDDLLCTNSQRINKAIVLNACNALLLKLNQIGTVYEAISAFQLATKSNWNVMVSHRSGETEDSFIADLAVGLGNGQIKSGAPCRGERIAKYNRLLRIEEELGKKAKFAIWKTI